MRLAANYYVMGTVVYCFIIIVPSEACLLAAGAVILGAAFAGFAAGGGLGGVTFAAGGGVGALMTAGLAGAGFASSI